MNIIANFVVAGMGIKFMKTSISMWAWALNEEDLLEAFIEKSFEDLDKVSKKNEIIIVDDGSTDKTWPILQNLTLKYDNLRIIHHRKTENPGACMAVCAAMTSNEIIFWNTVDSFFDTSNLKEWVDALEDCDMVQGVRIDIKANTPYRKVTHLVNYWLIRILYCINLAEFQNVKFFRKSFLDKIVFETASVFTNAELAIKANRMGLTIKEKSMVFNERKAGKAKCGNPALIAKTFYDIFWFRFFSAKGKIIKL